MKKKLYRLFLMAFLTGGVPASHAHYGHHHGSWGHPWYPSHKDCETCKYGHCWYTPCSWAPWNHRYF